MGSFLWFIIIGGLAGWIAGKLMKGIGSGVLVNFIVGIIGGVLGGWLFDKVGIVTSDNFFGSLLTSVIGAVVFLWLISLFRKS